MVELNKILCPLQLQGENTEEIVGYGASIAKAFDAELILLHVFPNIYDNYRSETPMFFEVPTVQLEEGMRKARRQIDELMQSPEFSNIRSSYEVACGKPAFKIIEVTVEKDIDVIVMGTRGRQGINKLLMGSVAQELLNISPAPILIVR